MSCGFSRETLALHAEGDLTEAAGAKASAHLADCQECQRFLEQLRSTQAMVKSLRMETAGRAECADMRRGVMEIIASGRAGSGWILWLERGIVLGVRRRSY